MLGGLLSAYHLSSNDPLYLEKAVELADRILPVFETPSGLPLSMVNLANRKGFPNSDQPTLVSTAEAATLQLEFRYLSFLTDNDVYWKKAETVSTRISKFVLFTQPIQVMKVIKAARQPHGLASIFMRQAPAHYSLVREANS